MYVKKRRPIYVRIKPLISFDVHLLAKMPMKLSFIMVQVVMKDLLNEREERDKFVVKQLSVVIATPFGIAILNFVAIVAQIESFLG